MSSTHQPAHTICKTSDLQKKPQAHPYLTSLQPSIHSSNSMFCRPLETPKSILIHLTRLDIQVLRIACQSVLRDEDCANTIYIILYSYIYIYIIRLNQIAETVHGSLTYLIEKHTLFSRLSTRFRRCAIASSKDPSRPPGSVPDAGQATVVAAGLIRPTSPMCREVSRCRRNVRAVLATHHARNHNQTCRFSGVRETRSLGGACSSERNQILRSTSLPLAPSGTPLGTRGRHQARRPRPTSPPRQREMATAGPTHGGDQGGR